MNRRKGVPCGCDADPCGCSPRNHCVKAINNVSPDPNGDFGIAAGENVTISETEYGIEISATGGSAEDAVKSVNGELPDPDGDVTIDTGVMTVNGVSPDADGEVTITAGSNITITPDAGTNSVEISASGETPQAVAPIYIDGDGKINLAGWELFTSVDWTILKDANDCATEDLIISLNTDQLRDDVYIPKGSKISNFGLNAVAYYAVSLYWCTNTYTWLTFFTSSTYYPMNTAMIAGTKQNSGTEERINLQYGTSSLTPMKITDPTSSGNGIRLYRRATT